ncbi:MAG TPA: hypothetical protein VKZ18_06660 [Polyangia bacterium]|nr:hypothetical protein [Polyangia bacterium]
MQRTTRLKLLLGLGAAAALAMLLLKGPGRGARQETPPPAAEPAAAPAVAPPPPAAPPAPPPAPHPPGPDRSPSTTAAPPPPGSEAARALPEAVLMARLRSVAGGDFPLAVELARAGNRRFPDSPDAPERASILIHALAAQGMAREARGEAEYAVNHYPDSEWVRDIEGFTGAHRHRNLVLTDGGQIQAQ